MAQHNERDNKDHTVTNSGPPLIVALKLNKSKLHTSKKHYTR